MPGTSIDATPKFAAQPEACMTEKSEAALPELETPTVAVRAGPSFGSIVNVTTPPEIAMSRTNEETELAASVHAASVVTSNIALPPAASYEPDVAASVATQPLAWFTVNVAVDAVDVLVTVSVPDRIGTIDAVAE